MPCQCEKLNRKKGNDKKIKPKPKEEKPKEEKPKGKGLTDKQKKNLPLALQRAILAKRGM